MELVILELEEQLRYAEGGDPEYAEQLRQAIKKLKESEEDNQMEKCPNCNTYLVGCPCCSESFCPDCYATETELEEAEEEDNE